VCPQRGRVGPVLDEDQAQRIFAIAVNRVRQAPRFLPGTAHVGQAERETLCGLTVRDLIDRMASPTGPVTARDPGHGRAVGPA